MSPQRRRLMLVLGLVVALLVAAGVVSRFRSGSTTQALRDQTQVGPVLLVPGYGGTTEELQPLAAGIRATGREVVVVELPDGGTGDLRNAAKALATAVTKTGATSVDVVGYSAGGVIARLYAASPGARARRVITLGSPHHGTRIAAAAAAFAASECTTACEQLVPGSTLLRGLAETPGGASWVSFWSTDDEVVTPPSSARLTGAVNVAVQDLCKGLHVSHGNLPTTPQVMKLVLAELQPGPALTPTHC